MSISLGDFSDQLANLIDDHAHLVVRVEGRSRHASTGVVWSSDGYILTSNYTVEFDDEVIVGLPNGDRVLSTLVGRDPGTDLALLKLELDGEEAVELGTPEWMPQEDVRLGNMILTLARPGRTLRSAMGIISTMSGRWAVLPGVEIERFIQSDCVTRAGFSGSLVIDVKGQAVGMLSAGLLDRDHVILPVSTLEQAVDRILRREPPMLDLSEAVESRGSISEASSPVQTSISHASSAGEEE